MPPTLTALKPVLPAPPARLLEAGCGRGALAAALVARGYDVTGVDRDAEMAETTGRRGVRSIHADINQMSGEFDVVLFTRSLHHAEDLPGTLAHAATLLAPGGRMVIEEFSWERVSGAEADFLYGHRARLVRAGLLEAEVPIEHMVQHWVDVHRSLHSGKAMVDALGALGPEVAVRPGSMLWRLVDGRGGRWTTSARQAGSELDAMRVQEEQLVAAARLAPVGLIAAIRFPGGSTSLAECRG